MTDQEPLPLNSGCWFALAALTAISAFIQHVYDPFELGFSPWLPIISGGIVLILLVVAIRTPVSSKPPDDSTTSK
jgi:hypothetical protein